MTTGVGLPAILACAAAVLCVGAISCGGSRGHRRLRAVRRNGRRLPAWSTAIVAVTGRWHAMRDRRTQTGPGSSRAVTVVATRADVADLVGRLSALARAGVPAGRAWQVLASGGEAGAIAGTVARMVGAGGSVADGLRLVAATGGRGSRAAAPEAIPVVQWLAITSDVIDAAGAPSADVYDGMAAGILAELARLDEQEVALAGPRTTAAMLAALPLAGAGLGLMMGVNAVTALTGTGVGRACLLLGAGAWVLGRWWSRRLVTAAATVTA